MRKGFLLILLYSSFSFAQISDTDAKIIYQQAEDLYNQSNYYDASQKALQLKEKMGSWTPKVLYLHLKSAYKNYTESNQKSQRIYSKDYKTFSGFVELSDTFFGLIDKASYPQEKYKEIQDMYGYFQKMMKVYEIEKDRSPQDAIDFLNDCAKQFRNFKAEFEKDELISHYVFSLSGSDLIIKGYIQVYWGKYYKTIYFAVYKLSLSKITGIESRAAFHRGIVETKEDGSYIIRGDLYGFHSYKNNEKVQDYAYWLETDDYNKKNFNNKIILRYNKNYEKLYDKYEEEKFRNFEYKYKNPNFKGLIGNRFNIFPFFDTSSEKFKNENYEERIIEAFQFLIDYFPKSEEANTEQIKGKF